MNPANTIEFLSKELGISVSGMSQSDQRKLLAEKVNDLLLQDFEKLVSLLYRMDISEPKLRSFLQQNPGTDAGLIIADLMIEREEQKIISRQQFKSKSDNIDEDEKW